MRLDQYGKALLCLLLAATQLITPSYAADVTIGSSTATGVNLNAQVGSTVDVLTGVTVSNTAGSIAVTATTSAWGLGNAGTISANTAAAVSLAVTGSSVTNTGTITSNSSGIVLGGGGSVDNRAGATISSGLSAINIGTPASGVGTVINAGTITHTGTASDTVLLRFGGTVTNFASGQILSNTAGGNAVSVGQGTSRTVENYGLIRNTGTGFAAGVLVQGGASTVNNYAGATISGTYNGVYASSTTPLSLSNAGTISSIGTNVGSRAVEATAGGTIINTGTIQSSNGTGLYFGGGGTITNTGTISGAVRAIQFGTTNVTRNLVLGTGSTLAGDVLGSVTGTDTLRLEGTGSESLARFLNFEQLTMAGSAWTVANSGTFSTSASVTAGRLTVSGTLTTPSFTVGNGGTLAGTGTIVGPLSAAGTIDLGTGTLGVTGSVAMSAGSQLSVGVTPATSGRLAVTGATTLTGGSVRVTAAAGTYAASTTYTILSTTGGVTGTFTGGVTTDRIFLSPVLTYDASNVFLTLNRGLVRFASIGRTPNQIAAASGLDALPGTDPLAAAAAQLDVATAPAAFDQVSGEVHGALPGAIAMGMRLPRDLALRLVDDSFAAIEEGKRPRRQFWAQLFGSAGVVYADGNAAGMGVGTGGILAGTDVTLGDRLVSVFGGVGSLGVDIPDRSSIASIDQFHLGVAVGQEFGAWRLKAGVIGTASSVSTTRRPAFSGFSDTERSQYWMGTGQLFADLSYAIEFDAVALRPFGRLTLIGVTGSSYAETGGAAALQGRSAPSATAIATLGITASTRFDLTDGMDVEAYGTLALQQTAGAAPTATHRFGSSGDFTVSGASPSGTSAVIEAGLSSQLAPGLNLDLAYSATLGGAGAAHATKATLSGSF